MSVRTVSLGLVVAIGLAGPAAAQQPTVLSTDPANGVAGVATDLAEVVVTFSEPMDDHVSLNGDWNPFTFGWSSDGRELVLTRRPDAAPWVEGHVARFILNPQPYVSMADLDGHLLGTYAFAFTVGDWPAGAPTVTATSPVNGATDVDVHLDRISVAFSQEMQASWSVVVDSPAALSLSPAWSPDRRTLDLQLSPGGVLVPDTAYTLWLNLSDLGFRDDAGRPLATHAFSFTTAAPSPDDPPIVISADPPDGAAAVSRYTGWVTVTFSKPMTPGASVTSSSASWVPDQAAAFWDGDSVYRMPRIDPGRPLPAGGRVTLTLNPGGEPGFADTFGNALPTTTISFRVEGEAAGGRTLKILPEDSRRDFSWPYYLWIPDDLPHRTVLLVEPNNTGMTSDWQGLHDRAARELLRSRSDFAAGLDVPLLVPTFPRPRTEWWIYTHALDRDTLTTRIPGLERIDLQLIEMIEDARERLLWTGIWVDPEVLMLGFSASGQFTNRFSLLHPERIRAAAAGSPGGWPLAPVAEWAGEVLPYNVGIADVATLLGRPLASVCTAPLFLYMGDADTNDSVPFTDSYDPDQAELVNRLFGDNPVARWPHAEQIYRAVGCNASFALYPGVGHWISAEMWSDIEAFFGDHLDATLPPPRRGAGRCMR